MSQSQVGKLCAYCQYPIKQNSNIILCAACKSPHHQECWNENGGCTTFACNSNRIVIESDDLSASSAKSYYNENNSELKYAGFWKRVGAHIIDTIILYICSYLVGFVLGATMYEVGITDTAILQLSGFVLGSIIAWLYHAILESSSTQATVGKMALGIKVTDLSGNQIAFGKATGRYFGKYLSGLILGIGYLMVAFTEKKQGLHDLLAGCLVVNKK